MIVNNKYNGFLLTLCVLLCCNYGRTICGYKACHPTEDDKINIHLVPHSHDDLGYKKTVDQYYHGTREDVYPAGVQYILDSVVEALQKDSNRRFIYVEIAFFWKWWLQQDNETRNIVKKLVNNGQLEFVNGGWSMNDEAGVYYQTFIDQMTLGLRKLNETFGECGRPTVTWQIDPFGHSREMASLFAQMGYDGLFINRIDYQDLAARKFNRSMEFLWRGSPNNLGQYGETDIFTHILFQHYSAPSGLCFDVLCNDDSIVDDVDNPEYNVDQKAESFIYNWVVPASSAYSSNNILVPMGGDFHYQFAEKYFKNMDKLIRYINGRTFNGSTYNIFYSTPSCYLNAVHNATNGSLNAPIKTDDFFPYASSAHNYWTGYYSSRPTGKGYSRYANNFLQVCKQLNALTKVTPLNDARIEVLKEALGIFQHHDAITGTERENVAHDYIKLMHNGMVKCEEVTNQALFYLIKSTNMTFTTCPMLNISECGRTEKDEKLVITVYNPLGRSVNKYVRLPVEDNTTTITIKDPSGASVQTQLIPIHPRLLKLPGRNSTAKFNLVFRADNVPPLGFRSYFFEKSSKTSPDSSEALNEQSNDGDENSDDYIEVTGTSSGPKTYIKGKNGLGLSVGTAYYYYTGFVGNGSTDEFSPSQPYVFRPDPEKPLQPVSKTYDFVMYQGKIMTETHWFWNDWFSYIDRHYGQMAEFNYLVGPLPYEKQGVEVVVRFNTDLVYDDNIFMDTNGRETIERVRNYRPTWNASITEPESGNYYPVVSGMTLRNNTGTAEVTVLTDRGNGGGSMKYQTMEFMIHRNTINTTDGLGEPLNEQAYGTGVVASGTHYLVFGGTDYVQYRDPTPKEVSQEIYLDSWIFFASPNGLSFDQYKKGHVMEFSGLSNLKLPRNIHILSLEPWGPSSLLLRLENFIGKEDKWHSAVSKVNLKEIFSTFEILSVKETTLGGNYWLGDREPMIDLEVELVPMAIRTFILTIAYK